MQRSPHGSRLLAFQRAHGITDTRSHTAAPARHTPHGARPQRRRSVAGDGAWSLLLLVATALLFGVASIICADPSDLLAPPESMAAEVSP